MKNDYRRMIEIVAVIITGIGKFIFMDWLGYRLLYIAAAIVFWVAYIFYRKRNDSKVLAYWGLTKNNFKKTFLELLPIALLFSLLIIYLGKVYNTSVLNWSIVPILLIYPIWGIIQQFIMIGILAKNLNDLEKYKFSTTLIIVVTALIFAIVHYPSWLLVGSTFLMGLAYTFLYLRGRNLIVLGIFHGWVGALFFYTILGRDPWLEVFGMI